ncbi:MAG TPA: fatty acid--CoA ligase family protein [Pyrinomonadaceae bacterium]|nr:fatty acid--CoA ligase family protein [Pyrinomonadaceae bacterium]
MQVDLFLEIWRSNLKSEAIVWKDHSYSYSWLLERFQSLKAELETQKINPGAVVVLKADFSPSAIALFFALAELGCIVVPLAGTAAGQSELIATSQAEFVITVQADDSFTVSSLATTSNHRLYQQLREAQHPGLVLFSSGSTGESKAAVHDLLALFEKFKLRRHSLRTISFLLYDHIGGVNTMLYTFANAGCLVIADERNSDGVLHLIEKHRVELLPTSPTFLNLILLSEAYKRHDLSSLRIITYGTEPMSETTLKRFHQLFPTIKLVQTYGLSEVGIMRSRSKSSDSLWVKVGGEGYETRIVDGVLQIKAQSAMLGYLNAPSPFTDDHWFNTGDAVEVDGDYLKILGRTSEVINVGGEKVYPTEIESVILEVKRVADVTVYGERNPITGQIVCANITPISSLTPQERRDLVAAIKQHCRKQLQNFKVPVRITFVAETQHTERFKKVR